MYKQTKWLFILAAMLLLMLTLGGCGADDAATASDASAQDTETGETAPKDIPKLRVGYIHNDHSSPIMVAAAKADEFSDFGVYLNRVVDKELYQLMQDGEPVADFELIVTNSGSDAASLFASGQLDISFFSSTVVMNSRDRDIPVKVLGPIHTEGNNVVFTTDLELEGWDDFYTYVKGQPEPVKIGFLSPTSAATIILKGGLESNGITFTEDPADMSADVLLINLRAGSNFMPSVISGEVEGFVAPSPWPLVAEHEGVAKTVFDLRDMPPEGSWVDFPCCCLVTSDDALVNYGEVLAVFVELMNKTAAFCNEERDEAGAIISQWIGIPEAAAKRTTVNYTTYPSEGWLRGNEILYGVLSESDHFEGNLKDKTFEEVKDLIFDFRFTK